MIGTSPAEYLLIRFSIFLLQYSIQLTVALILSLHLTTGVLANPSGALIPVRLFAGALIALLVSDTIFFLTIYLPFRRHANRQLAKAPARPITPQERRTLFARVLSNVPDPEPYLRTWFLGARLGDIRRENVREFFAWALFDRDVYTSCPQSTEEKAEMDGYLDEVHRRLLARQGPGVEAGSRTGLLPGRGPAKSLRLTLDPVEMRFRSVVWYAIVMAVDIYVHASMKRKGFAYVHATSTAGPLSIFPPRPQLWSFPCPIRPSGPPSPVPTPSAALSYWYRPHTSKGRQRPVLFVHGIGIGLLPYRDFLSEISNGCPDADGDNDKGQVGIIALELLPISMRYAGPPLDEEVFLAQITAILAHHGWLGGKDSNHQESEPPGFVLACHSYGSALTTHMLRSPELAPHIAAIVLIDPVSLLLHLPDVAYNFTRRKPRRANEWQLWFFASMEPGTALALGRHFFWRQNVIWKEELLLRPQPPHRRRNCQGQGSKDDWYQSQEGPEHHHQPEISPTPDPAPSQTPPPPLPTLGHLESHRQQHHQGPGIAISQCHPRCPHALAAGRNGAGGLEGGGGGEGSVGGASGCGEFLKRKVAVSLAGRDLIVDTKQVAEYIVRGGGLAEKPTPDDQVAFMDLFMHGVAEPPGGSRHRHHHSRNHHPLPTPNASDSSADTATAANDGEASFVTKSGIELFYFPTLDHAQVFDKVAERRRLVRTIRKYCRRD